MSDFDGLISAEFKQFHIDMITEVLRGCNVPCQLIYGNTQFTDCPNCIYDSISGRSSGRYQSGGPISFTSGVCPYCNGIGKIPTESTDSIDLCPVYDYKSWVPTLNSNIASPNGYVQTLSVFSTYSTLQRAKEIIINTDTTSTVKARFERNGDPQPCGIGSSSFIATMWKRIEN